MASVETATSFAPNTADLATVLLHELNQAVDL
jgi:hypothetical protein